MFAAFEECFITIFFLLISYWQGYSMVCICVGNAVPLYPCCKLGRVRYISQIRDLQPGRRSQRDYAERGGLELKISEL